MQSFVLKFTRQRNWIKFITKLPGLLPNWSHEVRKHRCFITGLLFPHCWLWDPQLYLSKGRVCGGWLIWGGGGDTVVSEDMALWNHFIITLSGSVEFSLRSFMSEEGGREGGTEGKETLVFGRLMYKIAKKSEIRKKKKCTLAAPRPQPYKMHLPSFSL